MQIQGLVKNYRNFLIASWDSLSEILASLDWDNSPYFVDEWMQANWELLVERHLDAGMTLLPYGFDQSDRTRYSSSEKMSTHRIICDREEVSTGEKYTFLCFTGKVGGGFEFGPPFDYVYVEASRTKKRFGTELQGLQFKLDSLSD